MRQCRRPGSASEFGIVRILTRAGPEGLGEISITFPRIAHSLCHAARRCLIAPALVGRDALERPKLLALKLTGYWRAS
jgi:L-alanine-DL-glutamate epimerase-like enolase superfamily enzyme